LSIVRWWADSIELILDASGAVGVVLGWVEVRRLLPGVARLGVVVEGTVALAEPGEGVGFVRDVAGVAATE
jgi:hypothetical protein